MKKGGKSEFKGKISLPRGHVSHFPDEFLVMNAYSHHDSMQFFFNTKEKKIIISIWIFPIKELKHYEGIAYKHQIL